MKLRNYQENALTAIHETFESSFRQYIELPTGAGKTVTFLSYAKNHSKTLVIVPSIQILHQVYNAALIFYDKAKISRRGSTYDEDPKDLHICIINSIRKDYREILALVKFDLVIIDEAHHTQADSYRIFIDDYSSYYPKAKFLGVTATPDRSDGKLLKDTLHTCSFRLGITQMIRDGYLCDIEGYGAKTNIDLSDVDTHNGDFSMKKVYNLLSTEYRNNLIVDMCKKELVDRKTLIFCINVEHSETIFRLLKKAGFSAAHIDGRMSDIERLTIYDKFKKGEITHICNCKILTEGFDEPSIDGIILARPTVSKSLFLQMIGRGIRIFPGKKNCKILDIVDNHKLLSGFHHISTNLDIEPIERFSSIEDIETHVGKKTLELAEFKIERKEFFTLNPIDNEEATESMINYLEANNITYFEPLSFDEGSFLIWKHKLNLEYKKWLR